MTTEQAVQTTRTTFDELCEIEPRLRALYERAKAIKDDKRHPYFCANDVWYGRRGWEGLKPELCNLVGHWSQNHHPKLRSRTAYDIAYHTIYDALPDCRNCGCIIWWEIVSAGLADKRESARASKK